MGTAPDRVSRTFVCVATAVATLLVAWCAFGASREWFTADDFAFLLVAERPKDWFQVFLPLERRWWWSYRPLTTHVFFSVCLEFFGHEPFGFLALSLSMHLLTGLVVYRLARQFGFEPRVAVVTALLSISRYPSLTQGFWISVSQYTVTVLVYALSLSLFIDYVRTARIGYQIASCAALILTLLSNEMGVTVTAVMVLVSLYLDGFSFSPMGLVRTLRRTTPHIAIALVYLLFRTSFIGPGPTPPGYTWAAGWHIFLGYFWALVFVFGPERSSLLYGLVPVAAALVAIAACRHDRDAVVKSLVGASVVSAGWIVAAMLPHAGMRLVHPRFAMSIEVPVSLFCGACFNAFNRVLAPRYPRTVEAVLLGVLVLSIPYGARQPPPNHLTCPPCLFLDLKPGLVILPSQGPRLHYRSR